MKELLPKSHTFEVETRSMVSTGHNKQKCQDAEKWQHVL